MSMKMTRRKQKSRREINQRRMTGSSDSYNKGERVWLLIQRRNATNFMFEGLRMIQVVKEDEKYVYLLDESGEVTEWDRDQAVGDDD